MKKIFLFLCLLGIFHSPADAQMVTINDSTFLSFLTTHYPSCMTGNMMDTTCADIVNEDTLIAPDQFFYFDLEGLQYFDGLRFLSIRGDLLSINRLPAGLKFLDCNSSGLTGLPVMPPTLETLICHINQLTSLPVLPQTLKFLSCFYNQLSILPDLPPNLDTLICYGNQLYALPALPNGLLALSCLSNQLSSLPPLPASLQSLYCDNNQLTYLPQVPDTMSAFSVTDNNIFCFNNLPEVPNGPAFITGNPATCVPNQTSYSLGLPVCLNSDPLNNSNFCSGTMNISGQVYLDFDADCNPGTGDGYPDNIPVNLYSVSNQLLAVTYTLGGQYSFYGLQSGSFQVKIHDQQLPFGLSCGISNTATVNLNSSGQSLSGIDFSLVMDTIHDFFVQSVNRTGWVFPGLSHLLEIEVNNNFTWHNLPISLPPFPGTVQVTVTGPVTYQAPQNNALIPNVNGNTFTYTVADLYALNDQSFGLVLKTDTTAQAMDQVCVHVEIASNPNDQDTTNNVYDFCYQVINSYDPNMKEVYPVTVLPGYDDWFTYTIHFQNTGTAPAFNIRLRDTLDAQLDLSTFEVRGFSHPANVNLAGDVLTVRFNNIILPDSTSDYDGSMGYFQYRIKPLQNLPLGTQIENTAYIYFDFNAPIITNTTRNEFLLPTFVQEIPVNQKLVLFPNPGSGLFFFKDSRGVRTVEVFNMLGEKVLNLGAVNQINLEAQPKGMYMVRVNGTQMGRVVKE